MAAVAPTDEVVVVVVAVVAVPEEERVPQEGRVGVVRVADGVRAVIAVASAPTGDLLPATFRPLGQAG